MLQITGKIGAMAKFIELEIIVAPNLFTATICFVLYSGNDIVHNVIVKTEHGSNSKLHSTSQQHVTSFIETMWETNNEYE